MSSEAMVSFLRKVAPGVEQSLQQNETVDIFQVKSVAHRTPSPWCNWACPTRMDYIHLRQSLLASS